MKSIVRVAAIEIDPLFHKCTINANNPRGVTCLRGFSYDLISNIFTGKTIEPVLFDGWGTGRERYNDTMIQGIIDGVADVTLPVINHQPYLSNITRYLRPALHQLNYGYLINAGKMQNIQPIFSPFTPILWLLGIMSYIIVVCYLLCIRRRSLTSVLGDLHSVLYQLSFRQTNKKQWKSTSEEIIVTVWSALARLVKIIYKILLVNALIPLSRSKLANQFNSMDKIVHKLTHDNYKLVSVINHGSLSWISPDHVVQGVMRSTLDLAPYKDNYLPSSDELVRYTLDHKQTIMISSIEILLAATRKMQHAFGQLTFVVQDHSDVSSTAAYTLARISKFNKTQIDSIERSIITVGQFGILEKLLRVYGIDDRGLERQMTFKVAADNKRSINLKSIGQISSFFLLSYTMAFICFLLECWCKLSGRP